MKLLFVVLLAGVWSTAVTASPARPFLEYGLNHQIFNGLTQHLEKYWETVKCIHNVVTKVVAESELKPLWDETRIKIEHQITIEWPKCASIPDNVDKAKCQGAVVKNVGDAITNFIKKVDAANKSELLDKIKKNVVSQCLAPQPSTFAVASEQFAVPTAEIFAQYKCFYEVLDNISKALGLQEFWADYEEKFAYFISQWQECFKLQNPIAQQLCSVQPYAYCVVISEEYVALAKIKHEKSLSNVRTEFQKNCVSNSCQDELIEVFGVQVEEIKKQNFVFTHFECAHKVLDNVSKAHGLQELWSEYEPKYAEHLAKWKQCEKASNLVARYICEAKEGAAIFLITSEYVKLAKKQNKNFMEYFGAEYKQTCLKQSHTDELTEMFDVQVEEVSSLNAIIAQFECMSEVLNTVSVAHGLHELWEKTQPQLEHRLDQWNQCDQATNKYLRYFCHIKEGAATYAIVREYVQLASAKDRNFPKYFLAEYKKSCGSKTFIGEDLSQLISMNGVEEYVQKMIQKIKCISEIISETVNGTKFQQHWNEARNELEQLRKQFIECPKLSTSMEVAKCMTTQLKSSFAVFVKFLSNLKEDNYDAYSKIYENIKLKCYA